MNLPRETNGVPLPKEARVVDGADFIGGQEMPPIRETFANGLGVTVFFCPHCDAKHLAISLVNKGMRRTVTFHGDDAMAIASFLAKAMASS